MKTNLWRWVRAAGRGAVAALAVAAAGCGGGATGPLAEATGTVTLDGRPLGRAELDFVPRTDPGLGSHHVETDASGGFTLKTDRANDPVRPGEYVVTVRKIVTGGNDPSKPAGGMGAVTNEVPPVYGDRSRSPLKADLKAGAQSLPAFELKH